MTTDRQAVVSLTIIHNLRNTTSNDSATLNKITGTSQRLVTKSKTLLDLGLFTTNAITSDGCLTTYYVSSRRSTVE